MNLALNPRHSQARVPAIFSTLVRDGAGQIKHRGAHRTNLRTNAGIDWQARVMGDYSSSSGTSTSVTATTMTNSGAAWATNQWTGHVVVGANNRYGVVLSNTATVLTIDKWYDPAAPGGTAGSTPATGAYMILPGGIPHWWIALSTDTAAPAAGDTTLSSEITGSGLARALPTSYTHTTASNTYSIQKTFTATGTVTVNKGAVFNASTGGSMVFESAEPSPPTLAAGETLQQTITVTY